MAEVKWIKIAKDFFNVPQVWYLEYENPLFLIYYMKLILKSEQVENENYGYISLRLGNVLIEPTKVAMFIGADERRFEQLLEVLKKLELIEVRLETIKVHYPWEADHTRNSAQYEKWKSEVLKRDKGICQECGSTESIVVHHKVPWRVCKDDEDLRYDIDNGICLCAACHLKAHNGNWRGDY